jgi:hypothetical protein
LLLSTQECERKKNDANIMHVSGENWIYSTRSLHSKSVTLQCPLPVCTSTLRNVISIYTCAVTVVVAKTRKRSSPSSQCQDHRRHQYASCSPHVRVPDSNLCIRSAVTCANENEYTFVRSSIQKGIRGNGKFKAWTKFSQESCFGWGAATDRTELRKRIDSQAWRRRKHGSG